MKIHYRIYNIHYFHLKFISSLFSWHCYQGNMDENSVDLKFFSAPFSPAFGLIVLNYHWKLIMCRPVTILDTQENTQYHFWYNGIIFLNKKFITKQWKTTLVIKNSRKGNLTVRCIWSVSFRQCKVTKQKHKEDSVLGCLRPYFCCWSKRDVKVGCHSFRVVTSRFFSPSIWDFKKNTTLKTLIIVLCFKLELYLNITDGQYWCCLVPSSSISHILIIHSFLSLP